MEFSFKPIEKKEEKNDLDAPVKGFGDDDPFGSSKRKMDNKEAVNNSIKRQEAAYKERLAEESSRYLKEDPSIYEYDEIYDQIRPSVGSKEKDNKSESRYMKNIIREHGRRTREQTVTWEKMEEKERDRERADNGNQPEQRFDTPAFKKLQEMRQKQEKIEQAEELYNKRHSVQHTENGMMRFYSGLFNRNVAGTSKHEHTVDKAEREVDRIEMQKKGTTKKVEPKKELKKELKEDVVQEETERERSRSRERTNQVEENIKKKEEAPVISREEKLKAALNRYKSRKQ